MSQLLELSNFRRPFAAFFSSSTKFAILINADGIELVVCFQKGHILRRHLKDLGLISAKSIFINRKDEVVILDDINKKIAWFDSSLTLLNEIYVDSNEISLFKGSLTDQNLYLLLRDSKKVISVSAEFSNSYKTILDYSEFPELSSSSMVLRMAKNKFLFLDSQQSSLYLVKTKNSAICYCQNFLKKGRDGEGFARNPSDINLIDNMIILHDNTNYLLQFFDFNLKFLFQIGGKGDKKGSFDLPVSGCAFGDAIIICDQNNDRIIKYNHNPRIIEEIIVDKFVPGNLCRPSGIALNNKLLYVADRSNAVIQVFDPNLKFIDLVSVNQTLHRPSSIALINLETETRMVLIERKEGANASLSLFKITNNYHATKIDFQLDKKISLSDPQDLDVDSFGKIYIANTLARKLVKISQAGKEECSADLAKISGNPRILIKCVNVRLGDNHIFTADFDNKIIYEFNSNLEYVGLIDLSEHSEVTCIRSVFATSSHLLVTVRGEHEVLKITYNGQIDKVLGIESISQYSWNHPVKMCMDTDQRVYFADKENDRIVLFDSMLKPIKLSKNTLRLK